MTDSSNESYAEKQWDVFCENNELRLENDLLKDGNAELCDELAKLRVLVLDMFSYAFNREIELCNACVEANGEFADCAACDEYDGACGIAKKRFEELYADRLRELEVIE